MKMISIIGLMLISASAMAAAPKAALKVSPKTEAAICQKLAEEADEDCVSIMCDEGIANGDFKDESDCVGASDYAEAAQGACEDTLSDAIARYNKAHAKTPVTCDQE